MLLGAGGLVGFLMFGLWIWAIIDCITADPADCRNLPRGVWLIIVIVLFDIGAILWLLLGRPTNRYRTPASDSAAPRRPIAVEGGPDLGSPVTDRRSADLDRRLAEWESRRQHPSEPPISAADELAAREADLARREADVLRREIEQRERDRDARERRPDDR